MTEPRLIQEIKPNDRYIQNKSRASSLSPGNPSSAHQKNIFINNESSTNKIIFVTIIVFIVLLILSIYSYIKSR